MDGRQRGAAHRAAALKPPRALHQRSNRSPYLFPIPVLLQLETEYDSGPQLQIIDVLGGCDPTLAAVAYDGVAEIKT